MWQADARKAGHVGDDIFQPGYQGNDPKAATDPRLHSYLVP